MSHLNPTYTLPLIWILLRLQLTLQHPPHIPAMSRLFSVYFLPISPIFHLSFSLFPSHAPPASFPFSVFSPSILSACRALLINQLTTYCSFGSCFEIGFKEKCTGNTQCSGNTYAEICEFKWLDKGERSFEIIKAETKRKEKCK